MRRKGQLFLIEVIISLTVLIVLITALFATISFSPPISDNNLQIRGENAINSLVETGDLYDYLDDG